MHARYFRSAPKASSEPSCRRKLSLMDDWSFLPRIDQPVLQAILARTGGERGVARDKDIPAPKNVTVMLALAEPHEKRHASRVVFAGTHIVHPGHIAEEVVVPFRAEERVRVRV